MVAVGQVVDEDDRASACGIRAVGIGRRAVLLDDRLAPLVRVVDVEAAGRGVIRREGDREKPLLETVEADAAGEVEERALQLLSVGDDPDPSGLLDHEEPRVTRR